MKIRNTHVPVKLVVEGLSSVVKQHLVGGKRLAQNGDYVILLHVCSFDHVIRGGNVLGMVLVMVDAKGTLTDMRLQCGVCIWQIRQSDSLQNGNLKYQQRIDPNKDVELTDLNIVAAPVLPPIETLAVRTPIKHNALEIVMRKVIAIMIITLQTLRAWGLGSFNNMRRDRSSRFPVLRKKQQNLMSHCVYT